MDAVRKDVEALVYKELEAANKRFPLFNSAHEGYATLAEEIDELKEKVKDIKEDRKVVWKLVKENEANGDKARVFTRSIKIRAILAAVEAIQVAAMCEKYEMSIIKDGNLEIDNMPQNSDKVYCKDCEYLNTDGDKPFCCHRKMSTNGLDDWCYHGKKRE